MIINNTIRLTAVVLATIGFATSATAADLVKGYNLGANDPSQLGSDFLFDQAALGGGDAALQSAPASFGWVAEYAGLWDIGTDVSITGLALPLVSNTGSGTNSTQNGDFTFTFFDLGGGADPDAFDGYNFGTMVGESILGTATGTFSNSGLGGVANQTDEYFIEFDTPIDFTSVSTGLAFHIQSTNTVRTKIQAPSATRRARRVGLSGTPVSGNQNSYAATLAGTPVANDPPPPPALGHRFDAALDMPGNAIWDPVAPTVEQFRLNASNSGDYNGDGSTNAADYTVFRDNLGGDAATLFATGSRDETNAGPINQGDYDFWAASYGGSTPTTNPVNDPSVPGITQSFSSGAIGQANVFDTFVNGNQASRNDASFELWVKPESLAGGEQIIYEAGGSGSGMYVSLEGDELSLFVNGQFAGNNQLVSTTLTDTDWKQIVAVIHTTYEATLPSADDYLDLYVDGVLVASTVATPSDLNDWAGGNQAGLGLDASSHAAEGPISGTDTSANGEFAFAGEIAIFEYAPTAWDATEVLARYNAITAPLASFASAVPEPGSLLLLLSAGVFGFGRRR